MIRPLRRNPRTWVRALCAVLGGLFLAACEEPPLREVDAAEAALAQARSSGAERFATERFNEAQAAIKGARQKLEQRDYRGALSAASDGVEKSTGAARAAEAAKAQARAAAEAAVAETRSLLEEVKSVRDKAAEAKVPDKAFGSLQAALDEANSTAAVIAAAIERGDFVAGRDMAVDLRAKIATLPGLYRHALENWQAAHGRRRLAKTS